ncbi:TPA: LysR family transcriptional regulator [Klebsiella aerogenes]|nr:LysR family transcriptional regulator [Klebsiella aerogenes]
MNHNLDIRLLQVIHMICVHGSATKAAVALKISTASISYLLKKARDATGHHLFIRTHEGMKPDTMALEFSARYQRYLTRKDRLRGSCGYQGTLTLRTTSPIEILLSGITHDNERVSFRYAFIPQTPCTETRLDGLMRGQTHVDIGGKLPPAQQIHQVRLFSSRFVVLAGQKMPGPDQLTMSDWRRENHIDWSSTLDYYCDDVLKATDAARFLSERQVVMASGNMLCMAALCSVGRYLMLIPEIYALQLTRMYPLRIMTPPPELSMKYDSYLHYNASQASTAGLTGDIYELGAFLQHHRHAGMTNQTDGAITRNDFPAHKPLNIDC